MTVLYLVFLVGIFFFISANNTCLGNKCSHICALSATHAQGYRCLCPFGLELDSNSLNCSGKKKSSIKILCLCLYL